jgi:2-polyprenyl-6-methoxyphenol hydroxylase-like FAD-dependent oxidoreductase
MTEPTKDLHFLSGKKIIIAGAGIAGLSFAISIQKQWSSTLPKVPPPTIKILERETLEESQSIARQGYSLSLRSDSGSNGIQSIGKMGIIEVMTEASVKAARSEGAGFCMWNGDMKPVLKIATLGKGPEDLSTYSLRIVRKDLRRVLTDAAGDIISWGRAIKSVATDDKGVVTVTTADGESEQCDLFIAADGASSKVRSYLRPDDKLIYRGYYGWLGNAEYGEGTPPYPVDRMWGMLGDGRGPAAFLSPVGPHTSLWSVVIPGKEEDFLKDTPEKMLEHAKEASKPFISPLVKEMQERTDLESLRGLKLKDKEGFAHEPGARVIYIGDANHAVSPYAGNGANLALADGWDLAEWLVKSKSLDEAVAGYDAVALPRAKHILNISHWTMKVGHSRGWKFWLYMRLLTVIKLLTLLWFKQP